ncbi:hypothetical protein FF011L_39320 [Roseimaritima multifibrata]|uniref:Gingipain domain-containing protein n=1 Tax=Roseimaritima multifibrata TaxID=1930274 RepID=A0A517MJS0_9BACT|nr:hypothetical protein [Roseimaritima multifibrata]QDS95145.1 hypothetical protein FF011L_39320 [Roseimaritima multifibrata]
MYSSFCRWGGLLVLLSQVSVVFAADSYAIVVSQSTHQDPRWQAVTQTLQEKHPAAKLVVWKEKVDEALEELKVQHPRYTCFVATPQEAGRQFVADVHQLTRRFDADPYTDTLWGVLTGFDAENANLIAKRSDPLIIEKVAGGTEVAWKMCMEADLYDELVPQKHVVRRPGTPAEQRQGPQDTTRALAETLTSYHADLFVTSGHATERNWQIGFAYRNGYFRSQDGQMFGQTTTGERFEIDSKNPKVLLPIGNCLMGHIDGKDAMALAWMNSVGVHQMIGYTVTTWYGYGGWGVLDYFVEQPGRYTLAEAFHANHHALIHRLETGFSNLHQVEGRPGVQLRKPIQTTPRGKSLGLTQHDATGLMWDRDVVAFYGDPAWEARMHAMPKAYEQNLTIENGVYTFTIDPQAGEDSFKPINENGSQRGWRPIVMWLPNRIKTATVTAGQDLNPVITDDFILVPNPRSCDTDREYKVVFTAEEAE